VRKPKFFRLFKTEFQLAEPIVSQLDNFCPPSPIRIHKAAVWPSFSTQLATILLEEFPSLHCSSNLRSL